MDGFDEDEAECECDDGSVVLDRLLAAKRDALEALQLAHGLLDAGSASLEHLRKERWPVLGVALGGNSRTDPARARRLTMGPGGVAFVAHSRAGCHVRTDLQQHLKAAAITGLAFGHMQAEWVTIKVGLEMDLGREAAA